MDDEPAVAVLLFGHVLRAFAARRRRLDVIQTQPARHHDQPATLVVDVADWGLQQAEEGLLHHVFGRSDVAEHPKCEVHQIGAMRPPRITDQFVLTTHEVKDATAQPNVTSSDVAQSVTFRGAVPSFQSPMQTVPTRDTRMR